MTGGDSYPYDSDSYETAPADQAEAGISTRSRGVALALGLLGGVFGLHRFYAGRIQSGVWQAVTLGGLGIWWLFDVVLLVAGEFRDADGRFIRRWETAPAGLQAGNPVEVRALQDQVDTLQRQISELAERMDFTERLLARDHERRQLK